MPKPKKIKNMSHENILKRVHQMMYMREEFLKDIDNVHVRLQPGNTKTGKNCYTVSLIPIADCKNCSECMWECYDIINVCFQPYVMLDRARNSAVHHADIKRFWDEVEMQISLFGVTELRLNVGGDLVYEDFDYINGIAERKPKTDILFFTKSYDEINKWLDEHSDFEPNVKPIMSAWKNMPMDNRHNLPVAHVLYIDGSTTAPEYGAIYCGGNCSRCWIEENGCWTLPKGSHLILPAH